MMLRATIPARLLVFALGAVLVLGGCTSVTSGIGDAANRGINAPGSSTSAESAPTTSTPAVVPKQAPITFSDCSSVFVVSGIPIPAAFKRRITLSCAQLNVPLDYAHPSNATTMVQLLKIHDSDNTHSIGSLLVNPGGPGGSGINLAAGLLGQVSPEILSNFDLVGFDPRGVGFSSPISCISNAEKDTLNAASPDVLTSAGFDQAKQLAGQVADACTAKYGTSLQFFDTVNTAKDMDMIRQAVGDAKMNYLGFSYGTELGAIYAHLFPGTVRAAVLDGAVDPLADDITSFADQLGGFEGAFDQFSADCITHPACKSLGNPRQVVHDIVAATDKKALPTGESRVLTSSLALTGVLEALYSQSKWNTLAAALVSAKAGNGSGLLALADQYNQRYNGTYTNIADANTAINCNDSKAGPGDATIRATATSWVKKYPMFGLWAASSLFSCQQWQPVRQVPPLPIAATPNKVLVIGNLHDPATPYQGAINLAKAIGSAVLLSWDGEGHTSYLQGSSCIDNYVNQYLINLTLPPMNMTCPR